MFEILPEPVNDWRSVAALVERLNQGAEKPSFTPSALRHYASRAGVNGLAPHVRRIGRKILIRESGFLSWLEGRSSTRERSSDRK